MEELPKILICYTTTSSKESSDKLIQQLLEDKTIACGVSWSAGSQYNWQDKPVNESEYLVLLKTSLDKKKLVINRLEKIHPYKVPCILFYEVECNSAYGEWVASQTK